MISKFINEITKSSFGDERFETLNNSEDVWKELDNLFIEWEEKIEEEHQKNYVTDDVENKFKEFVEKCIPYVVEDIEISNVSTDKIKNFFHKHRHAGYGFYTSYEDINSKNNTKLIEPYEKILSDIECKKIIYCSLAEYFSKFYGHFSDNEMAIRMLCKYYSNDLNLDKKMQELLVSALYTHVLNAGTPGDTGYAYGGILAISKGINNLSNIIVKKLLKKYSAHSVIYDKIRRRQIHTIIEYSKISNKKDEYKFFFIDSVLLAELLSQIIFSKYNNENKELKHLGWGLMSCGESELPVFKKENDSYKCFWIYKNYYCRFLKLKNKTIAKISLNGDIIVECGEKIKKIKKIKFDYDDWVLNKYETRKFYSELKEFIKSSDLNENNSNENNSNENNFNNKFLFSHVFLDGYRGIRNQQLSFDHKYYFDGESKSVELKDKDKFELDSFYGKNIYSLSCIVGKNGTGKTSIVEFLHRFFFVIVNLIEEDILDFDGKVVRIKKDLVLGNNVLKKEVNFLVIFNFNNNCYILTNKEDIKYNEEQISPYYKGLLANKSDNSKIIYFSNMINANDYRLFDTGNSKDLTDKDKVKQEDILKSLQSFRNVDYSENFSFIKKQNLLMQLNNKQKKPNVTVDENNLNNDFIYKITFLNSHNSKQLKEWFGSNFNKDDLSCNSIEKNSKDEKVFMKYLKGKLNEVLLNETEKNLFRNLAYSFQSQIEYFSSGQYAKVSFLSKLYWCLKGYDEYHEILEKIFGSNIFYIQDTLQENDTAIIFIDEGELYYHPEWQRTYIQTLIDIINSCNKNIQIQIVMTTNSPFIISDIRREDIMYLPFSNNESGNSTFGQNIHTLLKNNFFMNYTIGEFARKKIEFIINQIRKQDDGKYKSKDEIVNDINKVFNVAVAEENVYGYLKNMIELIGENIYRVKLLRMLDNCMPNNICKLEKLEQQMREIQEQMKKIKEVSP